MREDGIPLRYGGPYELTDTALEQMRLALQVALTPVEHVTTDLRLVEGRPAAVFWGSGCANVTAGPGQELVLEASAGRLSLVPSRDTVLHVRRTGVAGVAWDEDLAAGTRRQLELALPASPGSATGLLSLGFPDGAHLTLCGRTLVEARRVR